MFRVIFLFGLVLLVTVHSKMHKCGHLMHGGLTCCNKEIKDIIKLGDFSECNQIRKKPPSCDMEICIAQKLGFASSDGTIDMKAFVDLTEKTLENDTDLIDRIKDTCVTGDLSKYGKEDFCDLAKLKICCDIQVVKSCSDWKDDGECKGMKDLAAECIKEYE